MTRAGLSPTTMSSESCIGTTAVSPPPVAMEGRLKSSHTMQHGSILSVLHVHVLHKLCLEHDRGMLLTCRLGSTQREAAS